MTLEDIASKSAVDQLPNEIVVSDDDAELFKFIESSKLKIFAVGTGGSGCNTMNRMYELGIDGVKFVAMNTDVQHLVKVRADKKILLGKQTTRGMGAGSNTGCRSPQCSSSKLRPR